jgi:two-component system invasion response regulator UvrY
MSVRVLIADDQRPFRKAAQAVIDAATGFRLVGEAVSGEEALELVGSLSPDLVLMDIKMPEIGGIEAARVIAAGHPNTLTILLSTYREEDLPDEAGTCGALAYLHKSDFSGEALRTLWENRPGRPLRGRGSPPSHACEFPSPRQSRA